MPPCIRPATPDDASVLLDLIRDLAVYEREPDAVETTVDDLRTQLSAPRPPFSCLLAEVDGESAGFALFFQNYSTWRGRPGVYLEDLFVRPSHRGRGVGRLLLSAVAREAVARGCVRLEWSVLDWNAPALGFYARIGAHPLREWVLWRLGDHALRNLAAGVSPPRGGCPDAP